MLRQPGYLLLFTLWVLAGCSKPAAPSAPVGSTPLSGNSTDPNTGTATSPSLTIESSIAEKYQQALVQSLSYLADRKYAEALTSLQAAQALQDTDLVREQIAKVEGLVADRASFDRTVADIQTVIDQGQAEQAVELVTLAMAQYTDVNDAGQLASLKRQANALITAKNGDVTVQITRYRQQAEKAKQENNLRAALLSLEEAQAVKADAGLQQEVETLRTKLNHHDAALERATQLRRQPYQLEEASKAYEEALALWDTVQVRQALADTQLAIQKRRDRIAVANFEVQGDSNLAANSVAWADELLPHFKTRFDLVERSQINRLMDELKVQTDDVLTNTSGQQQLASLAKARYLVVGSISPLAGITIHARLIDLDTGLIVQTAKLVAPTAEEASKKMPQLAAQLMMNDEEKLAYERQLTQNVLPTVVEANRQPLPAAPSYQPGSTATPIQYSTARPPAFGNVQLDDFDRLPAMNAGAIQAPVVFLEQERPLRSRLLAIQIELGDNLFKRGLLREAMMRYQLARELEPGNFNIIARINACQQYLPPMLETPVLVQVRRDRLAFLNFFVSGDGRVVSPELSTWTPDQLMPYFSRGYDVVDRGEVFWMMGRLGLTLSDVLKDTSVRRWLGRALGVRYFVVGRIQAMNGISVTTSMLDAEQGWEVGRGQILVQHLRDLKLHLPELARFTMMNPAERQRMELEAAAMEAEYLRAQEAARRGQLSVAINIGKALKLKQPFNIRVGFFLNDWEEQSRRAAMEEARVRELERQRQLAIAAQRRQAELVLAAERARENAMRQAASIAAAERQRQRDLAQAQLLAQARINIQGKNFSVAIQLFDSALAFRPQDDALLREAAQARLQYDAERRQGFLLQQNRLEEARRRDELQRLSLAQQTWQQNRQRYDLDLKATLEFQRTQDQAEYARLVAQADRLQSQGRYDQAAAALQAAIRINPSDATERKLRAMLMEQARAEAKAQDASKLADLEKQLAIETARRKQAEEQAKANQALYQAALQLAIEAQRSRNYTVAVAKYQEAGKLFQSDEVARGLRSVQQLQAEEAQRLAKQKAENDAKQLRAAEVSKLLASAKQAEQQKKWDEALATLQRAKELEPTQVEVQLAITRTEQAKLKELQAAEQNAAKQTAFYIAQARARAKAKQFDAAIKLLEGAPKDPQIDQALASIKDQQKKDADTIAQAKAKEEETRRLAALRIQEEEQAKLKAAQAKQSVETALRSGDLKAAELALEQAKKLAPRDPALIKLNQELVKAQSQAAREKTQIDAKARLEAEAQTRLATMQKQQQGKVGDILAQAKAAIDKKNYSEAEKLIGDALALDSTNLGVARLQRELQTARQAEVTAKSAMSAAERKKQDEETAKKKVEFARVMKEGKEALAAEDLEKASKLFTEAKNLNPDDADAAMFLGMARRNIEREKAEEDAKKQEEEARKAEVAKIAKLEADKKMKAEAELRNKLVMDEEARKKSEMLKAVNQQQFDGAIKQGKQLLAAKKFDEAIAALTKATQLVPSDKEAATLLTQAREQKEAVKMSPTKTPPTKNPPTKTEPSNQQLLAQAQSLQKQQKWAEALDVFQEVLKKSPNDSVARNGVRVCEFQIRFEAGKAALQKKDKAEAIKAFEAALKFAPEHTETLKLLKAAKALK
jgi:colicin import membrane protein